MHSTLLAPLTSTRGRVSLVAGLGAGAAVVASVVATSGPAFATDESAAASAAARVDNHMFAVVDGESGGLFESDGHVATSVKLLHTLNGQGYRITFDRDIRQCAYVATPTASTPGELVDPDTGISITQNDSFATRNQLDVLTKAGPGDDPFFDASSFSLMVECRS